MVHVRGKKGLFLTTDFKTNQVSILKIGLQQVKGSSLNTRSSNNLNLLKMNIKREFEIWKLKILFQLSEE